MYYLGIDVHKHDSHVAVLDDDGEVVHEGCIQNASLDEVAQQYAGSKAAILVWSIAASISLAVWCCTIDF